MTSEHVFGRQRLVVKQHNGLTEYRVVAPRPWQLYASPIFGIIAVVRLHLLFATLGPYPALALSDAERSLKGTARGTGGGRPASCPSCALLYGHLVLGFRSSVVCPGPPSHRRPRASLPSNHRCHFSGGGPRVVNALRSGYSCRGSGRDARHPPPLRPAPAYLPGAGPPAQRVCARGADRRRLDRDECMLWGLLCRPGLCSRSSWATGLAASRTKWWPSETRFSPPI